MVTNGSTAAATAPARALFRRLPPASVLASLAVLAVVLLWSLVPGLVTGHDPTVGVPDDKFTAPGAGYWLGTDHLGRDLLTRIVRERGIGVLLITHDMGVVAETADRVIVQYKGRKMEEADVLSLFEAPKHPYTRALLSALPENATGDRLPTVGSATSR